MQVRDFFHRYHYQCWRSGSVNFVYVPTGAIQFYDSDYIFYIVRLKKKFTKISVNQKVGSGSQFCSAANLGT